MALALVNAPVLIIHLYYSLNKTISSETQHTQRKDSTVKVSQSAQSSTKQPKPLTFHLLVYLRKHFQHKSKILLNTNL